jgi:effector-binding domain-containing protein
LTSYDVDVVSTQTVTMAVARATLPPGQISEHIIELFDRVYAFLKTATVKQAGLNVALYLDGVVNMEAGVPVTAPFEDTANVHCSFLPAGQAAHTIHYGPYSELGGAHNAVRKWCEDRGLATTGVSWEIYGHWNDDPALLRTDVYYLLKE